MSRITPRLLLDAYARGLFPMAPDRDSDELRWFFPEERGILPLDGLVVSRSLAKTVRSGRFRVTSDRAFDAVMRECAAPAPGREDTWISPMILSLYGALHRMGRAHSVEVWEGENIVGGLYGVSLGGVFCGESMFSRRSDASKVALVHLVAGLRAGGYSLLDTQYVTPHLASLGGIAVPARDYLARLEDALGREAVWPGDFSREGLGDALAAVIAGPGTGPRAGSRAGSRKE